MPSIFPYTPLYPRSMPAQVPKFVNSPFNVWYDTNFDYQLGFKVRIHLVHDSVGYWGGDDDVTGDWTETRTMQ